jgi:hypothetical protein
MIKQRGNNSSLNLLLTSESQRLHYLNVHHYLTCPCIIPPVSYPILYFMPFNMAFSASISSDVSPSEATSSVKRL